MTQLKELEELINKTNDIDSLKKTLREMHQILGWFYEWFQKIEEAISKEN